MLDLIKPKDTLPAPRALRIQQYGASLCASQQSKLRRWLISCTTQHIPVQIKDYTSVATEEGIQLINVGFHSSTQYTAPATPGFKTFQIFHSVNKSN